MKKHKSKRAKVPGLPRGPIETIHEGNDLYSVWSGKHYAGFIQFHGQRKRDGLPCYELVFKGSGAGVFYKTIAQASSALLRILKGQPRPHR